MEEIPGRPTAGRTVLVTGGTGGIGRATAEGLAGMGAHVTITGRDAARAVPPLGTSVRPPGRRSTHSSPTCHPSPRYGASPPKQPTACRGSTCW